MTGLDPTPPGPMTGLSHVQLNVTDPEASAAWYMSALGLEVFDSHPGDPGDPGIGYVALRHRPSGVVIVLTRRGGGDPDHAAGVLDHLAFAVPDGDALAAWAEHLAAIGIEHPGVVAENGNPSLQLRDPDSIAVELVAPRPRKA